MYYLIIYYDLILIFLKVIVIHLKCVFACFMF